MRDQYARRCCYSRNTTRAHLKNASYHRLYLLPCCGQECVISTVMQNVLDCAGHLNQESPSSRRLHTHYSVRQHQTERHEGVVLQLAITLYESGQPLDLACDEIFHIRSTCSNLQHRREVKFPHPSGIERDVAIKLRCPLDCRLRSIARTECDRGSGTHLKHR